MAQINSHKPFDFSPSGNLMARVDLPSNRLEIYKPALHALSLFSTCDRDSLYPNAIHADSISIWTDVYQFGPQKIHQDYWRKITSDVIQSDQIMGIKFLSDSLLLIRRVQNTVLHFDLLNVYSEAYFYLETPTQLIGQKWENHMMCVHDGKLYVLFPNKVIEDQQGVWKEQGHTINSIQGWRLVEVSIHE